MKKSELKQIIKEEISKMLYESSSISKGRAKSSLKQKLKGKRDDGMGAFTDIVYGIDKKGKEHELKSLTDVYKKEKFTLKYNPDVTFDNKRNQYINEAIERVTKVLDSNGKEYLIKSDNFEVMIKLY